MTKWAGKNGPEGSWVNHFRIPFYKSVRVTAQLDWQAMKQLDLRDPKWHNGAPCGTPPRIEICQGSIMTMFRGLEGDETALAESIQLGGIKMPPLRSWNVQLRLQKLESHVAQPLEFVPVLALNDSVVTGGAVFMTTAGWRGLGGYSIEGCWFASSNYSGSKGGLRNSTAVVRSLGPPADTRMLLGTGLEDFFNDAFGFG